MPTDESYLTNLYAEEHQLHSFRPTYPGGVTCLFWCKYNLEPCQ